MPRIHLPASLKSFSPSDPHLAGETVGDGLHDLVERAPKLKPYLFEGERLRPFVVVLHNGKDVKGLNGLATPIVHGDMVRIVASVAGG